jgi:hypothetical protein
MRTGFTKVAVQQFAKLSDQRGVQFFAARTEKINGNLLMARSPDSEDIVILVDDDNLAAFANEILRGLGRARN